MIKKQKKHIRVSKSGEIGDKSFSFSKFNISARNRQPLMTTESGLREATTWPRDQMKSTDSKKSDLKNRYGIIKNKFAPLYTTSLQAAPKQEVVSITYEEIGLFPRSFSRVLDRFLKQVFSDVDNLVIQEYRFYRYLFLTTLKCLLILFFVPFLVNFLAKSYVVRPLTEYFWNTKQTEIFLNSYQQKHAFAELKDFEEKLYFESLIYPKSLHQPAMGEHREHKEHHKSSSFQLSPIKNNVNPPLNENTITSTQNWVGSTSDFVNFYKFPKNINFKDPMFLENKTINVNTLLTLHKQSNIVSINHSLRPISSILKKQKNDDSFEEKNLIYSSSPESAQNSEKNYSDFSSKETKNKKFYVHPVIGSPEPNMDEKILLQKLRLPNEQQSSGNIINDFKISGSSLLMEKNTDSNQDFNSTFLMNSKSPNLDNSNSLREFDFTQKTDGFHTNSPTSKSSFLVYQTIEADKNIQQRYQEKTIELAQRYNDQSVEAITNFFGDIVSLVTLFYLFYVLEIQINITQSFLLEVFFGLDDSKKSLLILLVTDLLVGYHSSNLWELFFELFFNHYGLPESQTGIFLLVATLPVLLDVLFKYLIFRHLNRSSPATVATYHAIIE